MKEELGTWGAVVGAVVLACLFGGLVLAIYPGWVIVGAYFPGPMGKAEWIGLLSAVGTCAAVFVALYLSSAQSRKAEEKEITIARIHAAGLTPSLDEMVRVIRNLEAILDFSEDGDELKTMGDCVEILTEQLDLPSYSSIEKLAPLPNQTAARIARTIGTLLILKREVSSEAVRADRMTPLYLKRTLERWHRDIGVVSRLMVLPLSECLKATELGAPKPTYEELYT